jgi:hypothetical protein
MAVEGKIGMNERRQQAVRELIRLINLGPSDDTGAQGLADALVNQLTEGLDPHSKLSQQAQDIRDLTSEWFGGQGPSDRNTIPKMRGELAAKIIGLELAARG